MVAVALIAGGLAAVTAWRLVARGRASAWGLITPVTAALGTVALITGRVELSPNVYPAIALAAGLAAGALFYAATVSFVLVVRRWPVFERHVEEIYGQRKGLSLLPALLLASGITAPGEELFWRGLLQSVLAGSMGWWAAAGVTWAAYIAVNAASGSLAILAGGIVGGMVWGGLALWTHGVLASLACHAVWTALMLGWPPGGASRAAAPSANRAVAGSPRS